MINKLFRFIHNPKPYFVIISDFLFMKFRNLVSFVAPFSILDDKLFIKHRFKKEFGYKLNLKTSKTFNEKIQWLKLYYRNPLYTDLADKYKVREYVRQKIGDTFLIPLLSVVDDPYKLNWIEFPKKFVIKTTHSSKLNIICQNKEDINKEYVISELIKWLNFNHYKDTNSREWHMKDIQPRIIVEEYLEGDANYGLVDYKFFCFSGIPKYIELHIDRFTNHTMVFYDTKWEEQKMTHQVPLSHKRPPKPNHLENMLAIASALSEGIPFCRIDLYDFNDHVYFGEVTFTPGGGFDKFDSYETDLQFGNQINLPQRQMKKMPLINRNL